MTPYLIFDKLAKNINNIYWEYTIRPLATEKLTLKSKTTELEKVEKFSQVVSQKAHLDEEQSYNLAISLTELVNNAIVHGNKNDPHKKVFLRVEYYQDRLVLSVKDQGKGFDVSKLKDPTDPENIFKENGRGVFIVKQLMDRVDYNITDDGTEVLITLFLKH